MIIVTGSIAYDYIMEFPGNFGDHILPEQIHNVNLSFIVSSFAKHRGGTAGNVSYTMGLLKAPHLLFSYAGKDFGEYQKAFQKLGIETKDVKIDKTKFTATGFAMTDKSNNQIWGYYYGACDEIKNLEVKNVANKNDLVLIGPSGAKGSLSFVRQCVEQNIPYMFDPGFILTEVTDDDLRLGITNAQFIIGNDYEINLMQKRVRDFDGLVKNKIVIKTLGEKGVEIKNASDFFKINSPKAKKVVSTTGAGDAWRGGFLTGLAKGLDLQTCGKMGCVAASFVVEHFGTQEHFYTIDEFLARYRQTYNSLLDL